MLPISRYFRELIKVTRLSIFLTQCKLCERDLVYKGEDMICCECKKKIRMFQTNVCRHCGRPLRNTGQRCGECLINPPPFRKHISYSEYEEELKELILKFKYGNVEKLKHLLASYYIESFYKQIDESFDYIIPVPVDKGRKREYDPVMKVATILSKQLKIELLIHHLVKVKKTLPQAGLTRSQRLNNLNGAFKISSTIPSLKEKKILLIDDVYTTGTTLKKCTELLIKEDAEVVALTLAMSI